MKKNITIKQLKRHLKESMDDSLEDVIMNMRDFPKGYDIVDPDTDWTMDEVKSLLDGFADRLEEIRMNQTANSRRESAWLSRFYKEP